MHVIRNQEKVPIGTISKGTSRAGFDEILLFIKCIGTYIYQNIL